MRGVPISVWQTLAASLLVHGLGMWGVAYWQASVHSPNPAQRFEVELQDTAGGSGPGLPASGPAVGSSQPDVPRVKQARRERLDTDDLGSGQSGVGLSANAASRLADVTVSREIRNHEQRQQWQRLDHSRERRSRELHRATPTPMELSLITTGPGTTTARRKLDSHTSSEREARRKATVHTAVPASESQWPLPFSLARAEQTETGQTKAQKRARMSTQRPPLERRAPSVPAENRGRVSDRMDTDLAVSSRVTSLISASGPRGEQGDGLAGHDGAISRIGTGGARSGERALSSGNGAGDDVGTDPDTIAYYSYVRTTLGRLVQSAFPTQAKAEGRGGMAVFSFVIKASGIIAELRLERASGVPEYDAALRQSIKHTRLRPPPTRLGAVPMRMRFVGLNPAVGGTRPK